MKYILIALALFLGTAYFVQAAPFSWDYISGSNIVRLIAPQNTATVQVPALTSTATATLATSTGAVIVSPNETTWAKLGVGTSSPTEILHLSRPSWGYTTTRFDSGTTQGQFYAYGGDNTVAFGSRSVSPVNLIYGDSVRATLYGPNASSTILDLKSPSATGESTFTTTLPLGGSNREFIDWTLENYGTDHFGSINIAKQGTGTIRPFGIRFWNSDLGPIHENGVFQFLTYPTGHTAIGNYSSTTGNAVPAILRVGSSTTGSLFRVDNGSTTQYFLVSSAGASTTALTISGLSDGCLNVTSGLVGSTGSACGSGGGGGLTTWLPGTGYLYTATSTDGALAAYFSATSTTATSTIAGAVNIGSATTAARFGLRNILSQDTLLIEDQASDVTPFRIDQSGQVTTGGTITVGGNVNAYHGGTPGTGLFSFFQSDGSTGAFWGAINSTFQRLGIDGSPIVLNGRTGSTGNVGIGTSTTPTFKLQVNGANTQNIFRAASSTGSSILDILGTGIVQITGTTTTSNLSIGSLTGVLKATAGTVATGLVDLASEVTGRLGITNGGTGTSTAPTTDQILVGNSGGSYDYRRITAGSNITVSTSTAGQIQISAIGGGGSGTVNSGTTGQVPYYASAGTTLTGTSTILINSAGTVAVNGATNNAAFNVKVLPSSNQAFQTQMTNITDVAFSTYNTGDGFTRFSFLADGNMKWGSGSASSDVGLSRYAPGSLSIMPFGSATRALFSVGTTTNTATLAIQGSPTFNPLLIASSTGEALMRISPEGNVQIGNSTVSPNIPFTIERNSPAGYTSANIYNPAADGRSQLTFNVGRGSNYYDFFIGASGSSTANYPNTMEVGCGFSGCGMNFWTDGFLQARMATSGNMGFGTTTNLLSKLSIQASDSGAGASLLTAYDSTGSAKLTITNGGTVNAVGGYRTPFSGVGYAVTSGNATTSSVIMDFFAASNQAVMRGYESNGIGFRTGAGTPVERLRITQAGLVGIGTTTPPAVLTAQGTSTVSDIFALYDNTATLIMEVLNSGISYFYKPIQLLGALFDSYGSSGDIGDRLVSTGTSTRWVNHRGYIESLEDFITETTNAGDAPWAESVTGTGAACTNAAIATGNRPGMSTCTSGTTATGRAGHMTGLSSIALGQGTTTYEGAIRITTLSTVTERYSLRIGFQDTAAAAQVDGAYILYDEGGVSTGSAASANFQCVTASNSTRTYTTTGTAVAAATWYDVKIVVNPAGTSVDFYVNDTLVCNHTANIPTGTARAVGHGVQMLKSIGTTARTYDVDYHFYNMVFTTPR